ncbi:MAG: PAS domain S-box protein [Gallionellaceae bacterium]|nr:PAS domain S-box protein [Gallionellaceae bacterium]
MISQPRQLRRTFLLAVLLFVGGMLALASFTLWRLHDDAVSNGLEISAMHTRGFEDFLTQSLHVTELVAITASEHVSNTRELSLIERSFVSTLSHAPFLRSMSMLNEQGRIVVSSNPANVGKVVDTQSYLPAVTERQEIQRIGAPWSGRDFADGRVATAQAPVEADAASFIPVTRNLTVGARRVTLLIALNSDYFINHISQKLEANEGEVEVMRFDGTLLMSTALSEQPGSMHEYVQSDLHLNEIESGKFEESNQHKKESLSSFRASRLYPFVVVTHLNREYALQNWRTEAKTLLAVMGPALLVIVGLAIAFYRRQLQLAEQRLEAERLHRINATVFDASAEAIIITDLNANIISVNATFTAITGYSAEDVLGKNPRILASGKQSTEFYEKMWNAILQHGIWQGELVNRNKNGNQYEAHSSITVFRGVDGEVQHFIGVISDITLRKQAESELRRSNADLQRFAEVTAHHLQEPARRLASYAERLAKQLAGRIDDEDTQKSVEFIGSQARRLKILLGDIERYLAADQARGKIEPDVRKILDRVLDDLSEEIERAGAAITVGELPSVLVDAPRLVDLFEVAIGNALIYAKPTQEGVPLSITIEGEVKAGRVHYRIFDNGQGIEPQYRERVFKVFERLTTSGEGTGVGLSIVRRISENAGGSAWIEEAVGGGCAVCIDLPIR